MSLRTALRAARHIGRRGAALLFLAEVDVFYAASLLWPSPAAARTPTNRYFATIMPLDAWAGLWALVGVICIVYAFRHHDRVGFVAAMGIKILWSLFALLGMVTAGVPVSTPAIWISFAGFVWLISGWRDPDDEWTL